MTLDEAITSCMEVVANEMETYREICPTACFVSPVCTETAKIHLQLAEWLEELKQRREAEITAPPKTNGDRIRKMTDEKLAEFLNEYSGCRLCKGYKRGVCTREECF